MEKLLRSYHVEKNRKCSFNNNKEHIYSREKIILQSSNQLGDADSVNGNSISDGRSSDDNISSSSDEDDDDVVEVVTESLTSTDKESEAQKSGRFFAKWRRCSFHELENFKISREAFASAMKIPMDDVAKKHSQMEVDQKRTNAKWQEIC